MLGVIEAFVAAYTAAVFAACAFLGERPGPLVRRIVRETVQDIIGKPTAQRSLERAISGAHVNMMPLNTGA